MLEHKGPFFVAYDHVGEFFIADASRDNLRPNAGIVVDKMRDEINAFILAARQLEPIEDGRGIGFGINASQSVSSRAAAVPSIQSEQLKVMKEAMAMAKEAQKAQREHMRMMNEAMMQEYGMQDGGPESQFADSMGP